jgi:hypothetical protein
MFCRQTVHRDPVRSSALSGPLQALREHGPGVRDAGPSRQGSELSWSLARTPILSVSAPRIQPALRLGSRGDRYEEEADRVAGAVVNDGPVPGVTALSAGAQVAALAESSAPAASEADSHVERQLHSSLGHGAPLPDSVSAAMEAKLGFDFSRVRIHSDPQAASLARALDAHAFTYGKDIYLGEGRSVQDQRLMAHELCHVAQQSAHPAGALVQREPITPAAQAKVRNGTSSTWA